jgi:hypothetical protein
LTDASAQILAAWAINKLDIKDEKPTFQVFTGTTDTIYLLNTGSSGTNGSKDISDIMKSSCRILLNSDNMYTLEVLDSEVSNAMSQNPFGAGPWKTVQAQSMDELNSSYSSQIGNISISISSEADPAVLAN